MKSIKQIVLWEINMLKYGEKNTYRWQ